MISRKRMALMDSAIALYENDDMEAHAALSKEVLANAMTAAEVKATSDAIGAHHMEALNARKTATSVAEMDAAEDAIRTNERHRRHFRLWCRTQADAEAGHGFRREAQSGMTISTDQRS